MYNMKDFLIESQMQHSAGAPYKHEDATDVEILWHHGVPGAMALCYLVVHQPKRMWTRRSQRGSGVTMHAQCEEQTHWHHVT